MMISNKYVASLIATTFIVSLNLQSTLADPLHKVGQEGAWQHEQSGWVFPKQVGAFARVGVPYEIDGTYDVGARYEGVLDGATAKATVHIYALDSAAQEADFAAAKSAANRKPAAEEPFELEAHSESVGTKVTYEADEKNPSGATLYFIESGKWIVNVRTTASSVAASSLDRFVNDLDWDSLGSEPGYLH
jgi:hypothetical protein